MILLTAQIFVTESLHFILCFNAGATGGSFTVLVFANRLSSGLDIAYKLQRLQLQATFAGMQFAL
jgi:hypothetical protein